MFSRSNGIVNIVLIVLFIFFFMKISFFLILLFLVVLLPVLFVGFIFNKIMGGGFLKNLFSAKKRSFKAGYGVVYKYCQYCDTKTERHLSVCSGCGRPFE